MAHRIRLPRWARDRGAALNDFPALELGRTALVNVDMQAAFLAEDQPYGNAHARDIVGARQCAQPGDARGGRAGDLDPPDLHQRAAAGAAGVAVRSGPAGRRRRHGGVDRRLVRTRTLPRMEVANGDIVLDKYRYGAFSCPAGALPDALERLGVAMLIVTGTLTNCCVESTAREANMAGYKVIVAADATAAVTDAEHNAALLNLRISFADVRRTAELLQMIRALTVAG